MRMTQIAARAIVRKSKDVAPRRNSKSTRRIRKREIELHARYAWKARSDDRWLIVYRDHLLQREDKVQELISFAARVGHLIDAARARSVIESTIARRTTADAIGRYLGLAYAVRQMLGITTIGAIDVDKHGRMMKRKERNRLAKRSKRCEQGIPARSQSMTTAQLWKESDVSRATWYRRGGDKIKSSVTSETNTGTALFIKKDRILLGREKSTASLAYNNKKESASVKWRAA